MTVNDAMTIKLDYDPAFAQGYRRAARCPQGWTWASRLSQEYLMQRMTAWWKRLFNKDIMRSMARGSDPN